MEGLTPGRIVHYVFDDHMPPSGHRGALVVGVSRGGEDGAANLQIFLDPESDGIEMAGYYKCEVPFDEAEKPQGTWHWIERA